MKPKRHFRFCPNCGQNLDPEKHECFMHCDGCGFHYYFNPTVASAAFIRNSEGRLLFITRSQEPAKGKLAIPGGFVDIGERAEEGLRREIREEVGLEVGALEWLCSYPNDYPYKGLDYPVLDFLFATEVADNTKPSSLDGVESFHWLVPEKVNPDELAFPSLRFGLQTYLKRRPLA